MDSVCDVSQIHVKEKQIVIFLPSIETGGVERNAVFFANAMARRGGRVSVLYCRKVSGWAEAFDSSISLIKVGPTIVLPGLHERLNDALRMLVFGVIELHRLGREREVALVSFQSNVIAILLAKCLSIPIAVRLSNHYSSADNEKSFLRRMSEWGKKVFYRYSDVVIANSKELADDYTLVLGKEVAVIHNPVDINLIQSLKNQSVDDAMFTIKRRPIVVTAGRLVKQKNFGLLIRAMERVLRKTACDLVILGEGGERLFLEKLARDLEIEGSVHLIGHTSNPYKYFARSDLFALSSSYEGMPNVMIEAIACGLPVVSTDCRTGPREILCDGAAGLLSDCDDVDGLARNIIFALENRDEMNDRAVVASRKICEYELMTVSSMYCAMVNRLFLCGSR